MSVPFESGYIIARLEEAAAWSRGSMETRVKFDALDETCSDEEMKKYMHATRK